MRILDQKLEFFEQDSDEELPPVLGDVFLDRASLIKVRKGEIVVFEGAKGTDVFLVRSGEMQASLSSSNGREVILRQLHAGHLFGEMAAIDGACRSVRVVAVTDCLLAMMSGNQFLDYLTQVPGAGLWMTRQMSSRVRNLTEKTYALALLPTSSRIHAELLRLARTVMEFDETESITIGEFPTHAEIAARAGTHREGVSRELSLLAKEGIIEQAGRTLIIHSIDKLRSLYARISD